MKDNSIQALLSARHFGSKSKFRMNGLGEDPPAIDLGGVFGIWERTWSLLLWALIFGCGPRRACADAEKGKDDRLCYPFSYLDTIFSLTRQEDKKAREYKYPEM